MFYFTITECTLAKFMSGRCSVCSPPLWRDMRRTVKLQTVCVFYYCFNGIMSLNFTSAFLLRTLSSQGCIQQREVFKVSGKHYVQPWWFVLYLLMFFCHAGFPEMTVPDLVQPAEFVTHVCMNGECSSILALHIRPRILHAPLHNL